MWYRVIKLGLGTLALWILGYGTAAQAGEALDTRLKSLEQRIEELERSTVLSEPQTAVRRIEVYVDENGIEHAEPVPGARRVVTYQRERVYRRQTINEQIEAAIADADSRRVQLGVDAAIVLQSVSQRGGAPAAADGSVYQLASTDLYFTAPLARYTFFFADVVGLSGTPQGSGDDGELAQTNGYGARIVEQNNLSLREAWIRSELWRQRIALVLGRVDLTNYFDANAAANDETSQFLSDALVNNPALGLSENGAGMALTLDTKGAWVLRAGYQQSTRAAGNLSDSLYRLVEVDYRANPFRRGEGNYRFWYRWDNASGTLLNAYGLSFDQKVRPGITLFWRYGSARAGEGDDRHASAGVQFDNGRGFFPEDAWGLGAAESRFADGGRERLAEAYYNLRIAEKLRLSFHLARLETRAGGQPARIFWVPGTRLQASF